jgi:predicted RNA polymerase sigma factor
MCFHASRFEARKDANGAVVLYQDQNEDLWDEQLIAKGAWHLHQATKGDRISKYHIEASIAWWHTNKADTTEKWAQILQLYNQLLRIEYAPVAALNRTYALAKVKGNSEAIIAAEALKLTDNHFYFMLLGVLYSDIDRKKALGHFLQAHSLARTNTDRQTIQGRIDQLGE